MPKTKRVRKSLSLRLQPYEGTPLSEVADYLNSLDKEEATRRIGEILVMAFLPYALSYNSQCKPDNLRSAFLIARDMADKHFGIMALALGLDAVYAVATPIVSTAGNAVDMNSQVNKEESHIKVDAPNSSLIEGKATATEIGKLF